MDSEKHIGMDVHKESFSIAVINGAGKIVMECVIETKASLILEFFNGLGGDLQVTSEEVTWALVVRLAEAARYEIGGVRSRKNASMKESNKSDKIDAGRLVELLTPESFQSCLSW
jgi:hypothetical protein